MPKTVQISWLKQPEQQDYPAAESYLTLLFTPAQAAAYVKKLRKARMSIFASKDIFRASGLSLLGISNTHVASDKEKIRKGVKLSPLLLVRGKGRASLIVADGYHRLCAVYSFDEDALIPCKIV